MAMIREVIQVKGSVRRKRAGPERRKFISRVLYFVFKVNQEDMGAGEDFGLQRSEWLTSCFIDDV